MTLLKFFNKTFYKVIALSSDNKSRPLINLTNFAINSIS